LLIFLIMRTKIHAFSGTDYCGSRNRHWGVYLSARSTA
jgi:hypothetical protein